MHETQSISGAEAESTADCLVVVYPDESTQWRWASRRHLSGRPFQNGRYQVAKLPAGRYLAAAVAHVDEGQEIDPEYLERLRPYATVFEIREGERRELNLQLVRMP